MKQDTTTGSILVDLPTTDGVKHLPRLRISDVIRLKNRIAAERRSQILKNADDTIGRSSNEIVTQLHEHDSRPVDRGSVITWALDPSGMLPTLAMAWLRSYVPAPQSEQDYDTLYKRAEAEVDSWTAEWSDLMTAAAGVLNVVLEVKPKNPTDGGTQEAPPSQTSTTDEKPSA